MAVYKRATAKLRAAGIADVEIRGGLGGPCVTYPKLYYVRQTSRCFPTPDAAAQAVIDGYRPTITATAASIAHGIAVPVTSAVDGQG